MRAFIETAGDRNVGIPPGHARIDFGTLIGKFDAETRNGLREGLQSFLS